MVSPDSQATACLPSGRNSTYRPVQISGTGSKVSKTGTMTIWGDDAEAQNGFGVWLKVNYSCEVDLTSKKIVNVTMDQGRLPNPTVY